MTDAEIAMDPGEMLFEIKRQRGQIEQLERSLDERMTSEAQLRAEAHAAYREHDRLEEALREQVRVLEARLAQETARADGQEELTKAAMAALETEVTRSRARPQVCVAALVTDDAGRLLLVRHRTRGWEPPGGRVEGDEGWRVAAFREVREEAGLLIELLDEPPIILDGKPMGGASFASLILVAKARAGGEPRAADPDGKIVEARWFAPAEVPLGELSKIAIAEVVRRWVGTNEHVQTAAMPEARIEGLTAAHKLSCPVSKRGAKPRWVCWVCRAEAPQIAESGVTEREWTSLLDEVCIERQPSEGGWAVFSGAMGESPTLRAFFPGASGRALADLLVAARGRDGDEAEPVIFDPCVVPALLVSGLDTDGGLFTACHADNEEAIHAMASVWGRAPQEWT